MALAREVYQALEDIVGSDYITEEPAILDGYSFVWGNDLIYDDNFGPRHDAVILPENTEEVQAIVRVCNRYRIAFKAHASGFTVAAISGKRGFVPLDLRRMNRILEIDGRNKYAVVEPYVSQAQLQLEAMKKRLRPWSLGSGSTTSIIASSCCLAGTGVAGISANYGGRNPLAVEWVLPDGELLQLGTLGTGAGWFCGDGPGLSLRGVMRGYYGPSGGLGVITKAAVKLVPWYGPTTIESTGDTPRYVVDLPESFKVYTITFPSLESLYDAFYLFGEEEIAFSCSRRGPFTLCAGASGSNKEVYEMWQRGYFQKKFAYTLSTVIDASSPSEMEYKEKILRRILEETGGEIEPESSRAQTARYVHAVIGSGAVRGVFRSTGGFVSSPSYNESLDQARRCQEVGYYECKAKYDEQGVILGDADSASVVAFANATHGAHVETVNRYDPSDPDSVKGTRRLLSEATDLFRRRKVGANLLALAQGYGDEFYSEDERIQAAYEWMKKIKKAFDPRGVSESSFFVTAE